MVNARTDEGNQLKQQLVGFFLVATLLFAGCMSPIGADIYHGENLNPPVTFRPFVLESDDGSLFNSSNVSGKVLIVGFIYVNCSDVCPTTTSDMAWIQSQLGETERNKTRFLSITVDPWRDGPVGLTNYKSDHNVTWPHLTTPVDSEANLSLIEQVWTDFNIGLILTESNQSTSLGRGHTVYYDIDHTNGVVLVDEEGWQRVRWTHDDWNAQGILNDVRALLA